MLVGELVSKPVRCTTKDHVVADRVQRRTTARQLGISDAEGICYSDESGWGRLRFTGSAGPSRKPGVGNCRMIPCAKDGGRSSANLKIASSATKLVSALPVSTSGMCYLTTCPCTSVPEAEYPGQEIANAPVPGPPTVAVAVKFTVEPFSSVPVPAT